MKGLFGKYKVILAPMAGITDVVFRQLCKECGADLTYTEMVSAKGLSYANDKTRHLIDIAPSEETVGVQMFGHEPKIMASQAEWIEEQVGSKLACIDINMGCPARKIVKKGDGSALMLDPVLASNIVFEVKRAVDVHVTAKFRRGYYEGEDTSVEFAKTLEQAGIDAITVHGRYATQMYRGSSSNEAIACVKKAVSVPVVGNGDIKCAEDANRMVDETGCDAIMVARASLGNPWIFEEIKCAFEEEGYSSRSHEVSIGDRIAMMDRHAKMLDDESDLNIKKMRKLAPFYIKGIDGAAKARDMLSHCSSYSEFKEVAEFISERAGA